MRITVLAIGSRGDVQPYLALALGLNRAGYMVRLAAPPDFGSVVREHALDYASMGGNFRELMDSEATRHVLDKHNPLQALGMMSRAMKTEFEHFSQDAWFACQGSDAIIFSGLAVPGYSIAHRLQVPCFWAPLQPLTRTRAFPSLFISRRDLGPFNWASHLLEEQILWQPFRTFINTWRKETLGLEPFPFLGPGDMVERTRLPVVYGYSPQVCPKPRDWGDWIHVVGYWFLERDPKWQPLPALVDFIAAGPPPVYIGFGSMSNRQPEQVTGLILRALDISGQRGILATGWGGLADVSLPETVFKIDAAPHDWLFPQMAAVVHHGGAGTTAAGLRAGIPSVVIPFTMDQPFWAKRVYDLGVGTAPLKRHAVTAEDLANAIRQAVTNKEMRERAASLGRCVRDEDGVGNAVEAIQRHLSGTA